MELSDDGEAESGFQLSEEAEREFSRDFKGKPFQFNQLVS